MPKIPVKVVKWEEAVDWSTRLADKIKDSYSPDMIIAIARGGLVPARIVADVLGILDLISIKVEHWVVTASHTPEAKIKYPFKIDLDGKKVIIIDDITDTGDSLIIAEKYVRENFNPSEIKTATMQHIKTASKYEPDFYAETVTDWTWFMYPWNYWEDEINLTKKILNEKGNMEISELEKEFKDSYGILPPIPLSKIIEEMKRRKIL